MLSSHRSGIGPQDVLKKDSRGLSRVEAGKPGVPRLVPETSWSFSGCFYEVRDTVGLGGAFWDSTGFGALEEGLISSGGRNLRVPLISDSDPRVRADLGQESQASSWVEAWNSACLSRCSWGDRPRVQLYLEPARFSRRCTVCQCPFVLGLHPQGGIRRGVLASGSFQELTVKSGSFGMWHHPQVHVSNSFVRHAST